MGAKNNISGQWFGYFSYGIDYGPKLYDERVVFSLIIEELIDKKFKGTCIEIEGIGASTEVSKIEGSLIDSFITFKKEYPTNYEIDDKGNEIEILEPITHELVYMGVFNQDTNCYIGTWEITKLDYTCTGKWEMSRDRFKYGIK